MNVTAPHMPAGARAPGAPHWKPALERVGRLTPREQETFLLLAEGLSNAGMARRLHVTERTVRAHVAAVMEKLELDSRLTACLASYAFSTECANSDEILASRPMEPAQPIRQDFPRHRESPRSPGGSDRRKEL
ncbi:LuxR C-terminal-related transcriptional regulator [Streptomyces sp. NPDC005908]|uniref:response regulator transcription factor n=1 Tax=unclassified Streptomyces TaxID=2593676 RepID=UPI0033D2A990